MEKGGQGRQHQDIGLIAQQMGAGRIAGPPPLFGFQIKSGGYRFRRESGFFDAAAQPFYWRAQQS